VAPPQTSAFDRVCTALEAALGGQLRRDVVEAAARHQTLGRALGPLRTAMQAHAWRGGGVGLDVASLVSDLDRRTRQEGFHVLHDWDGKADRVTANMIAVDVLEFLAAHRGAEDTDRAALAILIDYYFVYILALLAMRAWDDGRPGEDLDRVTRLLQRLQGPAGSGQKFADDAETLILIATSHYEPHEHGYDILLERARALPASNRAAMALGHAQAMGGHLRFGFDVTYNRDLAAMRADNGADYPWLCFALAGLMDEYARLSGIGEAGLSRERVIEALTNGLVPDPAAFLDDRPSSLAAHEADRARFDELFRRYQPELVEAFARYRPLDREYSALALYFNFSQNLVKGAVVDALLAGEPWDLTLNDLFTGVPRGEARNVARERLARTLMGYARAHPDSIGGRLAPVVIYDPAAGRRSFAAAMRIVGRLR
jgi:hypothetical protein